MKSYSQFICLAEASARVAERLGKMSDSEFESFLRGRPKAEADSFREARNRYRSSSKTTSTQQPKSQQPPRAQQQPPRQQAAEPPKPPKPPESPKAQQQPPQAPRPSQQPTSRRQRIGQALSSGTRRTFTGLNAASAALRATQGDYVGAGLDAAQAALNSRTVQNKLAQRLGTKFVSKAVPGVNVASAAYDAQQRWKQGDYTGAVLSAGEAIPGAGVIPAGINIARDLSGESDREIKRTQEAQRKRASAQMPPMKAPSTPSRPRAATTYGGTLGSRVAGIGGKTTISSTPRGSFISTGVGSQRKTVQLPKTQLIRDPRSGKQVVGDLAFRSGKPTYIARPDVATRNRDASGFLANLSRATGIGGQREADARARQQEYRTALKSTQQYTRSLGITPQKATSMKLPGYGVGPKPVSKPVPAKLNKFF